ncbi:MAG: hypothetical protein RR419_09175, partial [Akkermansia sp.]
KLSVGIGVFVHFWGNPPGYFPGFDWRWLRQPSTVNRIAVQGKRRSHYNAIFQERIAMNDNLTCTPVLSKKINPYMTDPRLSFEAKGLFAMLNSLPWEQAFALKRHDPAITFPLAELINAGYIGRFNNDTIEINPNPSMTMKKVG